MAGYVYRHYPVDQADADYKKGQRQRYKITTINWTYRTKNGKTDRSMVHRNIYSLTLRNMIKFIRESEQWAEDVISIQKV